MTARDVAAPSAVPGPARRDPETLPSVSVIVPAYNEAAIIERNLARLHDHMRSLEERYRWEIVVVDDGSTDGTGALADAFAAGHPGVRVLHHRVNFHLGQALRYAFNSCRSDYLVTMDCDLSYSPDHVERLLQTIEDTHARIVIASPYHPEGHTTKVPLLRRVASRWANRFLGLAAKGNLSTLTGMVRAYDRRFLRTLNLKAMDTEINTEIVYKAQLLRARIVEIPAHLDWTEQRDREAGRRSSIRIRRSTLSSIFLAFIFRPFMFFILPGLLLATASAWMLLWFTIRVGQDYAAATGSFDERFSDALASAFDQYSYQPVIGGISLLLAAQFISLGIVAAQSKRYFEELFHLGSSILKRTGVEDDDPT
ncbi:MAG: glycosyltransferase family 2 protein [Acidimicrobiia bacterium]|nr:glycosyltransferase family 2 protein [Acidimicrobiia bacterium]